jgi:transcriptional antiterminator NusG
MHESSDSKSASEETDNATTDQDGSSEDEEISQKKKVVTDAEKDAETTEEPELIEEPKVEPKIESSVEPTVEPKFEAETEHDISEKPETPETLEIAESKSEEDIESIKTDTDQEEPTITTPEVEGEEEYEDKDDKSSKGSFLELDTETRERMKIIEEEEQRAAEEQRIAEEEAEFMETGIFAIKTSIGHEKMVANWIALRARKRKLSVFAILSPPKLRGYLLLEGVKNKEALQDLIKGVQHARSVVDGMSSLEEIEHFLTPKPLVSGIEEGDVVEIIAGPFKGEKAKVTQIDESKEEITVELFEAMVSIPVTIRGDHVRILEKEGK